jgi:putative tricarboxylic transport membrane protein
VSSSGTSLGASVVAAGLVVLAGVRGIGSGAGYDRIGPRFFPIVIAAGMIGLGGILAISGRRRREQVDAAASPPTAAGIDWRPFGYFALAFLLFLVLMEPAGFAVTAALQFWLIARAFRSGRPARDAVIAVVLALIVYLAFSRALGLPLPAGILEGLL